jgi:protein-L-isoaspartate(D-aspartate) O-methyltransferase
MVERQIMTVDVTDRGLLDAMGELPREAFVPAQVRDLAYSDADLPITSPGPGGQGRQLVASATLARLVQLAAPKPGDIVLDIGCGCGYSSAVLAQLVSSVVAVEDDPALAAKATETLIELDIGNVAVVGGAPSEGYPAEGPYDVIFLGGSVAEVPETLLDQLKEDGRLVAIVGTGPDGMAVCFRRVGGAVSQRRVFSAAAPPLPGFAKPKLFQF